MDKNESPPYSVASPFAGLLIVTYVFSLPYWIELFNLARGFLGLPILKAAPAVALITITALYFVKQTKGDQGYRIQTYLIPCALVILFVVTLEANPIKHVHIPQYAILTVLIGLFLSPKSRARRMAIYAGLLGSAFGVIDEIHHGLHPERYFGWKDMVINACGSFIGTLTLINYYCLSDSPETFKPPLRRSAWYWFVFTLGLAVSIISVSALFQVIETGWLAYPSGLTIANISVAIAMTAAVVLYTRKPNSHWSQPLFTIYAPSLIAYTNGLLAITRILEQPFL